MTELQKYQGGFNMPQKNHRNNLTSNAYVYGNTVKKLSVTMPLTEPQRRDRRDDEQEKREKRLQQKQLQRAHKVNFLYTVAVVGVVAFIFTVCIQYLELQASVKNNSTDVSKLESQLSKLTDQNDMTEVEINGSIDYDSILDTAINQLGMVYPSRKQFVEYDSKNSEYVKQYSDIPGVK